MRLNSGVYKSLPPDAKPWWLMAGILVLLGSLFLIWEIISITAADAFAASRPETALDWRSNSAAALMHEGERLLAIGDANVDLEQIETLAQKALRANPLEAGALRILGLSAERRGDVDQAARLMTLAAHRAPRDVRVRGWLFKANLKQRNFEGALDHFDAMLRSQPRVGDKFVSILVSLASDAEARQAMVQLLGTNPPWRGWLLSQLTNRAEQARDVLALYMELRFIRSSPSEAELALLLHRLVRDEQYELAYLTWVDFLPPQQLSSIKRLNNGSFEDPHSGLPFDWVYKSVQGATTERVETGQEGNHALRITFHGARVPFRNVSQLLLLPSGWYELSGQVRASLHNERGMQWTITCADTGEVLGSTERVSGSTPWRPFHLAFEVASIRNCRAQVLRLELAGRVPAEQKASGAIWYDDMDIKTAPMSPEY